MPLPRPCAKCGKRFQPHTSANKLCDKCREKIIHENFKNMLKLRSIKYRRL